MSKTFCLARKFIFLTLSSTTIVVLLFSFKPHRSIASSENWRLHLTLPQPLGEPISRMKDASTDVDFEFINGSSLLAASNIPCRNLGRCKNLLEQLGSLLMDIGKWWKDYGDSCSKYVPFCKVFVNRIPLILALGGVSYVVIYAICNSSNSKR